MPRLPITTAAALAAGVLAFGGGLALSRDDGATTAPGVAAASAPSLPGPGADTPERIAGYAAIVRARPNVPAGYALLSSAYQQRSRESAQPGLLDRAEDVVRRGLAIAPRDPALLTQRASLLLARHRFRAALTDAERVHRTDPTLRRPYGALVDALVELGRYDRAGAILQEAIDRGPSLAIYARASYFQELHGDLRGAASALRLAASAGGEAAENVAYVQTLLGNLELASGERRLARRAYREALGRVPGYVPAEVGMGRLDAQRGRLAAANRRLTAAARRSPSPESLTALLETRVAAGDPRAADTERELRRTYRTLRASGENTGVERGLFEAQYGDARTALRLARQGLRDAPSVRAHDAYAHALLVSRRPREALHHARLALRLGSRDGAVLYRAALAARAAGEPDAARTWLRRALARNPRFSPVYGPAAERLLATLGG